MAKVLLALLLLPAAAAQGGVYTDTYNLLLSETLPGSLLPQVSLLCLSNTQTCFHSLDA